VDAGLVIAATGFAWASLLPGLAGLPPAALLAGVGAGAATPPGFAALAAASSPGRLGQLLGVRTPAATARTMSPM
jgi:hypothetical protein